MLFGNCFFQVLKHSKALDSCTSRDLPPNHFKWQASNTFFCQQRWMLFNTACSDTVMCTQALMGVNCQPKVCQVATDDPHTSCPTPRCHVCIWSGGATVGPMPGTSWILAGLSKRDGQSPGRCPRHWAVRAVHHQSCTHMHYIIVANEATSEAPACDPQYWQMRCDRNPVVNRWHFPWIQSNFMQMRASSASEGIILHITHPCD